MEEQQISWTKIYLGLMGSLVLMIALMYTLKEIFS